MSKTIGIYKVTSNFNTEDGFKLLGASSQIEVCTRDYMSWCKKGKAPKTMQAEYDKVQKDHTTPVETTAIFKVDILASATNLEELEALKTQFGLGNKGGKPKADKPKTPKADKPVLTPEQALEAMGTLAPEPQPAPEQTPEPAAEIDYKTLFEAYKGGKSVKDICAELGISKSTFYNKTAQYK